MDETPLRPHHRTIRSGIPVFWSEANIPFGAGIVFRVGRADEPMARSGITHLAEHLAFPAADSGLVEFNGSVGGTTTDLWATGPPGETLAFLAESVARIHELSDERCRRERNVLAAEAASRGVGPPQHAAALRFGPVGHGLVAYDELGLSHIGPADVASWVAERFTAANAAVYMSGDPPKDFDLALPTGELVAPPGPAPIEYVRFPSVFANGPPGTVAVSLLLRRSPSAIVALDVAESRVRERLRYRAGTTYHVETAYEPLTRDLAHAVLWADCLDAHVDPTRNGLLTVLDDLARRGPTAEELEQHVGALRRHLLDDTALPSRLHELALAEVFALPLQTDEQLVAERRAVSAADTARELGDALDSMLLIIPEHASVPGGRFTVYPVESPHRVSGRRYRPRGIRGLRPGGEALVIGGEGVMLEAPGVRRTVRFTDCVAALRWQDGTRGLWSRDGFYVEADPADWRGGRQIVELIDAAVRPDVTVPVDEEEPLFTDPDFAAGVEAAQRGDQTAAIELFERGLAREPNEALAWCFLAGSQLEHEQWHRALTSAERACELDPTLEWAHRLRGHALWGIGRPDDAAAAMRRALELDPAELEALASVAWVLSNASEEDDARRAADRAVELFPEEGSAWFAKGWVEQAFGRWEAAEPALRRAVELQPDESMWHNNLGWLLLQTGRERESLVHFRRALKLQPTNRYAKVNTATARAILGESDEAARLRREVQEADLARLREALTDDPDDAAAHQAIAKLHDALGRRREALVAFRRAAELAPDRADVLLELASHEADLGLLEDARRHLDAAVAIEPDTRTTAYYEAWLAAVLGDANRAQAAADRALALNDRDAFAWDAKGYAAVAGGRWDEAAVWLERAVARKPLRSCSRVWLAIAACELGDRERAVELSRFANATNPNCGCAARQRLDSLLAE